MSKKVKRVSHEYEFKFRNIDIKFNVSLFNGTSKMLALAELILAKPKVKPPLQKKHLHILLLIALLALQISCASKKNVAVNETVSEELPPKLIFLNYTISKDDHGNKHIQFINKIIADGKLKNNTETYLKTGAVGDLKCSQLDKDSLEIKTVIIKNPLSKIIEYVNDSLIFESKKIELKSAPLSLRLPLHDKTKYITISDIVDSLQNSHPIITTKLD